MEEFARGPLIRDRRALPHTLLRRRGFLQDGGDRQDWRVNLMELEQSLGRAIRQRRLDLGLSQVEVAERMGSEFRQSDISRIEQGRVQFPRPQLLMALAGSLNISIIDLMVEAGWLTPEEHIHYTHQQRESESPVLPRPLIVIADTDPVAGAALAGLLPEHSFRIVTAFDGETLTDLVVSQQPAAVVVDHTLPRLNLMEFSKMIRQRRFDTRIIVIGVNRPGPLPGAHFVSKPVDIEAILHILTTIDHS